MNGPSSQILTSAAVFRGELGRMLLAAGIVLLLFGIAVAIEVWRDSRAAGRQDRR